MSHLSTPPLYWAAGPPLQSAGTGTLIRWENTANHSILKEKKEESYCKFPGIIVEKCKFSTSADPTCGAEQEDWWLSQEPVDLVGDDDLSVSEGREGLAVGLAQGVIDVIEEDGECLATQVGHLWREEGCVFWELKKAPPPPRASKMSLYLSQLAFEQHYIGGGREDDVLAGGQSVNKPQASGLGLCYEST